jgi:hypothetical protein
MTRVQSPKGTKGWQVRDHNEGRTYVDASGTAYRELRQVDGAKPDVVVTYKMFPGKETWLRRLGPRQAKARLG